MTAQAIHQGLTPYQLCVTGNYSVIPSGGGNTGKSPLLSEWKSYQTEKPTLDELGAWEKQYHPKLWGVVTGQLSGVVVADVDTPAQRAVFDKAGLLPHIQTPRGGFHYWFKHPGYPVKTIAGILPQVDIRGDGGFINVIGQRSDGAYKVLIPPLPDALYAWDKLPEEIAKALTPKQRRKPPVEGGIIPSGKRHAALTSLAGTLRDKGLSPDSIEAALQGMNQESCKPPLEADEVTSIAQSMAKYEPTEDVATGEGMPVTNTDTGNAVRLIRLYGDCLRYCYESKTWYIWTGRVWQQDLGALINHYATQAVKSIYIEAANEPDEGRAKELAKHAIQSESNHRIVAMIARAESQPGIPIAPQKLDGNNWLLNCANGTIDLQTGELLPFDKSHYITRIISTKYDPNATCPIFDRFMDKITRGDKDLIAYIQKCVGYSLTGDTRTELVFFVYGEGQNGKSTFISTIRIMMGCYAHRVSPDVFMQMKGKGGGGPKESLANLRGKRFVAASEIEEGRRLHMALVKSLTGAESISADRKYEHEIEFQPTHHLWLSGNYRPEVRDQSIAAWRRLKIVPFTVHIPENEKDETLKFKLLDELPGILAWAVRGCLAYQKEGLIEPEAVTRATSDYRNEQDILGNFIDECCVVDAKATITNKEFRGEVKVWCISNGFDPFNTHQIKSLMTGRGFRQGTSNDGSKRIWYGLRLRLASEVILSKDGDAPGENRVDNTYNSDKTDRTSFQVPELSLIKGKHKKNMEKYSTSVKLSEMGSNLVELPKGYPDYPDNPCKECGSDLFWPGDVGWRCCTCDPRPGKDD